MAYPFWIFFCHPIPSFPAKLHEVKEGESLGIRSGGCDGLGEREDVNVVVRTFVSARVLEIELGREGPIQLEEEVQAQAQSPESGQALASAVGALQEQI